MYPSRISTRLPRQHSFAIQAVRHAGNTGVSQRRALISSVPATVAPRGLTFPTEAAKYLPHGFLPRLELMLTCNHSTGPTGKITHQTTHGQATHGPGAHQPIVSMLWHHTGCHHFLLSNFKYFLTLFSKFFSSFPHGTCSLSVSRSYLALGEAYHPFRAAIPNNSTLGMHVVRGGLRIRDGVLTLYDTLFQKI